MKIEQLLVQHFYKQRQVTLQGIGSFNLSPDFVMPADTDKNAAIPENAITFKYDSRAGEDEALILYIMEQTRKMKPLAAADLDSYLVLGKQFLNIGKPFKIEGLGMLLKNQQGEYQFTQGQSFQSKNEETPPALVKEKIEDTDISYRAETVSAGSGRGFMKIAAVLVVLGIAGAAGWYFFLRNKPAASTETAVSMPEEQKPAPDTTKPANTTPDSSLVKKDSIPATINPVASVTGSYTFRVVFRVMSQGGALKKKIELNKPNVIMYTSDSVHYKPAETFNLPLSDTTRIKDSLRSFYAFRTFVELNH